MKNIKFYAPAIGWGIFVFTLSVWPGKDFPQIPKWTDLFSLDKLVHMLFYGIMAALILRGWFKSQKGLENDAFSIKNNKNLYLLGFFVAVFCSCFGWFLEWFQDNYCSDRMFEVLDGVANTIGAFVGTFLVIGIRRKR
jgi:H+/Cl- antiporter ClcA